MFSPGWPGTHCATQAVLRLTGIYLLLPPECWNQRRVPLCPALTVVLKSDVHWNYKSLLKSTNYNPTPGPLVRGLGGLTHKAPTVPDRLAASPPLLLLELSTHLSLPFPTALSSGLFLLSPQVQHKASHGGSLCSVLMRSGRDEGTPPS